MVLIYESVSAFPSQPRCCLRWCDNLYHTATASTVIGPAPHISLQSQFRKDEEVQTTLRCCDRVYGFLPQATCRIFEFEHQRHVIGVPPSNYSFGICVQGMGEPLSNYEAVKAAVTMMADSRLFGISKRHITVSTVGVIPRIKQMAIDMKVSIAGSCATLCHRSCAL